MERNTLLNKYMPMRIEAFSKEKYINEMRTPMTGFNIYIVVKYILTHINDFHAPEFAFEYKICILNTI